MTGIVVRVPAEAGLAAPRAALAALFEPDRDALRLAPERLADALQLMLPAGGRPGAPTRCPPTNSSISSCTAPSRAPTGRVAA